MNKESRRYPRFPFIQQIMLATVKGKFFVTQSENLGLGGVFLIHPDPLPPGTQGVLNLTIDIEGVKKNITLNFRVIHNEPSHQGSRRMGIEFIGISPENKGILEEFIEQLPKNNSSSSEKE